MNESGYQGNQLLKKPNTSIEFTPNQLREYKKCMEDPVYFAETYFKTIARDKGFQHIKLYPFQKEMIEAFAHPDKRFHIARVARQAGKSTVVCAWILHYILFNQDKVVAILANKGATAGEILDKVKKAYMALPKFLQQGIEEWNKRSITLENGCRILAAATSSDNIRGYSINVLYIDEAAFIPHNIWDDFYSATYPTVSSFAESKIMLISTPNGLNHFYKIWHDSEEGRNAFHRHYYDWRCVPWRDDKWAEAEKSGIGNDEERWLREYEVEFLGSSGTLLNADTLKSLVWSEPKTKTDSNLRIYESPIVDNENPEKSHQYFVGVDTSEGIGKDYHAFTVLDITSQPYKVVATFRNNEMPPLVYPNMIHDVAKAYNNAYIMIELNESGNQVADTLYQDLEYENILMSTQRGQKGQVMDGGFGAGRTRLGVRMSAAIKRAGCPVLKEMIQGQRLIVQDENIVNELYHFVKTNKGGYEAEPGYNDDLTMSLVLFAWCTTQPYFKELVDFDIRKDLYSERIAHIEEELVPFGFISDGTEDDDFFNENALASEDHDIDW